MSGKAKKPAAKKDDGPSRAEREMDEVRRVHAEQRDRAKHKGRTEVEFVIEGIEHEDQKAGSLTIRTAGGRCFIESDGEVVLDHDGVADLVRHSSSVFQAV